MTHMRLLSESLWHESSTHLITSFEYIFYSSKPSIQNIERNNLIYLYKERRKQSYIILKVKIANNILHVITLHSAESHTTFE